MVLSQCVFSACSIRWLHKLASDMFGTEQLKQILLHAGDNAVFAGNLLIVTCSLPLRALCDLECGT